MGMTITTTQFGSGGVVAAFAEETALDASNGDALRQQLTDVSDGHQQVVIDFSNVTFVDSSALGAFVALLRRLNQKGGELKVAGLRPTVKTVFELTRLDKVFASYATVEEAVNAFGVPS